MAKTTTVTITCDQCAYSIDPDHSSRYYKPSLAFMSDDGLAFMDWIDEAANVPGAIHLHSDSCASSYLLEWLRKQRAEGMAVLPPVAVDVAPVVEESAVSADHPFDDDLPI